MDVPIDAALVRLLLTTQFPQWSDLPIRAMERDGWDNRSFRVGSVLTARLPSAIGYEPQVRKEAAFLPVLAEQLTLPIPEVLAVGAPGEGYPFEWSVRRWIEGTPIADLPEFGRRAFGVDIARFLVELRGIPSSGGPVPGQHSAGRGGPLAQWDDEVLTALRELDVIDRDRALGLWKDALDAVSHPAPTWFHGDVAVGNLLASDGRLSAVIDFGCSGVGDPSCDLVIAWTYLYGADRDQFRRELADDAEWSRGIGWALWKSLITADKPGSRITLTRLGVLD